MEAAGKRAIAARQSPVMMSSSGNSAASTIARNLGAAAESVNSSTVIGGFASVVRGGERRGFEQAQQIDRPGERETHRLEGTAGGGRPPAPGGAPRTPGRRKPA